MKINTQLRTVSRSPQRRIHSFAVWILRHVDILNGMTAARFPVHLGRYYT